MPLRGRLTVMSALIVGVWQTVPGDVTPGQ